MIQSRQEVATCAAKRPADGSSNSHCLMRTGSRRMAYVAEGQRGVAGHDEIAEQGERGREKDLINWQRVQVVNDVAIAVVRQGVLQHAQRNREQRQNQERLEERGDPFEAVHALVAETLS